MFDHHRAAFCCFPQAWLAIEEISTQRWKKLAHNKLAHSDSAEARKIALEAFDRLMELKRKDA